MSDVALNDKLAGQPEWIKDSTGKITGYKTGGADTVFPFSDIEESNYASGGPFQYLNSSGNTFVDVNVEKGAYYAICFGGLNNTNNAECYVSSGLRQIINHQSGHGSSYSSSYGVSRLIIGQAIATQMRLTVTTSGWCRMSFLAYKIS